MMMMMAMHGGEDDRDDEKMITVMMMKVETVPRIFDAVFRHVSGIKTFT